MSVRGTPPPSGSDMLSTFVQDIRFATRVLRKNPTFTFVAVAVIALGTGAVSTIFSVANGVVLQSLPGIEDPGSLVSIDRTPRREHGSLSASYPYYERLASDSKTMSGIVAWSMVPLTISTGGEGLSTLGNIVTANFFDVLGTRPALGRFFTGEERRITNTNQVVVISHSLWQRRFAGDSGIIGRRILVDGRPFTVIGVAPPRFTGLYPVLRTDAWVPMSMVRQVRPGGTLTANSAWLELFGRIAPGRDRTAAAQELSAIITRFVDDGGAGESRDFVNFTNARLQKVSGLPADATGGVIGFFAVLLAIAGLVLLIASVNVASMLLARAVSRRREIAVRVAIGAGRARLIRQLLTESTILFILGGAGGALLSLYGTRLLTRIELPVDMPLALDVSPNARVLSVTLAVALLTGLTFGLAPALQASNLDLATSLRADGSGAGRRPSRLRNGLVIAQVAVSLILLTASGLFLRALDKGRRVDIGFDASNVAIAQLDVGTSGYDDVRARAFYVSLKDRLTTLPGVTAVAYARMLPLSMSSMGDNIQIPGFVPAGGKAGMQVNISMNNVSDGYFAAMRIRLLGGRAFAATDDERAPRVAIVNETFVKRYLAGTTAVGQIIKRDTNTITIVGVVADSKNARLDEPRVPFLYLPIAQNWRSQMSLLVRTTNDPKALAPVITNAIHSIDRTLPAPTQTTLEQTIAVVLLPQRVAVAVTGVLGLAGLLLAVVGLYGVLSFSTAQRTREIGVRVALGALRADVLRLVVSEGMRLVAIGMSVGLILSLLLTRALTSFLFGVSPVDSLTFVAIGGILGGAALLACYLPARRAASVDPAIALRNE